MSKICGRTKRVKNQNIIDIEATQQLEFIFSVKTFVLYLGMYF